MNLPIYLYGHPVLRKECTPIPLDTPIDTLHTLIADMTETMYRSEGVGLAAPQIGRDIQLVVIDADPVGDAHPECAGRKLTLINPQIQILDGDPNSRPEGCLSLPGLSENVNRVEHILLTYLDQNLQPQKEEISGFLARIVQHECDHLNGTLYIDHISPIRKQLIRNRLNNIIAGKTRCDYPVRTAPRRR